MNATYGNRTGTPARRQFKTGFASSRSRWFPPAIAALLLLAGWADIADAAATAAQTVAKSVQSGPVELTAELDRPQALIAEPLSLTLSVQAAEGVTVTFPQQPATLGTFQVVKVTDTLDIPTDSGRQFIRSYQLENLVAGKHAIPSIAVAYTDRRGAEPVSGILESPPLEANITGVLEGKPDPLKFRDIKDVVELPVVTQPSYAWIGWSLGGAALFACAGLTLLVWPQRNRQLSADRWALGEFEALERDNLIAAGETPLFYFRLTDIVRRYIERKFGIDAPRLATDEFIEQATRHETLNRAQQTALRTFLTVADLVKFARFEPQMDDARGAIAKARQFVQQSAVEESD